MLCSDEQKEAHFRRFEHEDPAGDHTPEAAAVGGLGGLLLGGAVAAVGVATGGLALIAAGALAGAGGIAGSFVGVMLTRGGEGELADFYDQAVREGRLLVGVEAHGAGAAAKLAAAEAVFAEAGAEVVRLEEG